MQLLNKNNKQNFLLEIKNIIENARKKTYYAINNAMVEAYWLLGKKIVLEEQKGKKKANYGEYIIKELSEELTKEYGDGFSERNLRYFKQFYINFPNLWNTLCSKSQNNEKNNLLANLSWSHIRIIMRISNETTRNWYIQETIKNSWSVRTLDRNIATQYYERLLLSQIQKPVIKEMELNTKKYQNNKFEFIKNPTVLEFLGLPSNTGYTELELEKAIINNLQKFILELGKGFAFVGRQQLLRTETTDYYVDLVFYNFILKCFVLIDLKTTRITHQDVGQMDMYVRIYDELNRIKNDNPTIGIVLCSETDKDIAKYSILKGNEQLFATKYKLYLPTEEELKAEIEKEKINLKIQFENNNI